MKITVRQLKQLIKEQVEEGSRAIEKLGVRAGESGYVAKQMNDHALQSYINDVGGAMLHSIPEYAAAYPDLYDVVDVDSVLEQLAIISKHMRKQRSNANRRKSW